MIVEELTIFETLNTFDVDRAYWKNNKHCYIKGFIPKDALSQLECFMRGFGKEKQSFCYELWEHHVFAIWSYKNEKEDFQWEQAINLLAECKSKNVPVEMKLNWDVKDWFIYTQITEYLA